MKKSTKVIIISIILVIILAALLLYFLTRDIRICGTPFTIRNSSGGCELRVGCELPKGVIEDPTCREIIFPKLNNTSP